MWLHEELPSYGSFELLPQLTCELPQTQVLKLQTSAWDTKHSWNQCLLLTRALACRPLVTVQEVAGGWWELVPDISPWFSPDLTTAGMTGWAGPTLLFDR